MKPINLQLFADDDAGKAPEGNANSEGANGADTTGSANGETGSKTPVTYSQEDVDKMIAGALAKKLKGMPTKEEMTEYKKYLDSKKTTEEKYTEEIAGLRKTSAEWEAKATALIRQSDVVKAGISAEFAEYVSFEVGKLVTEDKSFEAALAEYVKTHEQYKGGTAAASGGLTTGKPQAPNANTLSDVEKAFYARNPNLLTGGK